MKNKSQKVKMAFVFAAIIFSYYQGYMNCYISNESRIDEIKLAAKAKIYEANKRTLEVIEASRFR